LGKKEVILSFGNTKTKLEPLQSSSTSLKVFVIVK
jgi:hypothetical protein